MKKRLNKRISVRKKWALNPKTKVKESERVYNRPSEKERIKKTYEREGFKA